MCKKLIFILTLSLLLISSAGAATVNWDFENGNDHGFALWSVVPPIPGEDDPNTAGDEALTGGLPEAGVAWTIGSPDMFEGLIPAFEEGCHVVDGVLQYGPCNDPFSVVVGDPPYDFTNGRGQSGYLGTYALSQWGDELHTAENDQIATSRPVVLDVNAVLTVWAFGNTTASWAGGRAAPELDPNGAGYVSNTGGIAVLSAEDGSLLASLLVAAEGGDGNMPGESSLDLSAFAGQEVIIEVVDAFAGGWGWLVVDEIEITNATVSADTSEGLVAYWPLDEGAGTDAADASGNGNEGIVNGDPGWVEGKLGSAIEFDGVDDYVDCGNADMLNFGTNSFTISAWVKTTVFQDKTIFGNGGDDGGGIRYHLFVQGNPGVKVLVDDDDTKYDPEGSIAVSDDQWHHIVGMRDGTSLRLYIDGVEDPGLTAHNESTLATADYDISGCSMYNAYIGAITTNNDGSLYKFFSGLIDDVAVWNRALTVDEISYLYNDGQGNPAAVD